MKETSLYFVWCLTCADGDQLRTVPNLLGRMSAILGISPEEAGDKEALVEEVWKNMWKFNQTYRVRLDDVDKEGTPVWCTPSHPFNTPHDTRDHQSSSHNAHVLFSLRRHDGRGGLTHHPLRHAPRGG